MKRVCFLLLSIILVFCVGCTKQWSEEKGYIYRCDIKLGDFAFLFDEWDYELSKTEKEIALEMYNAFRRDEIKSDDIFDALGFPGSTTDDYGVASYTYLIGDEFDSVTIKYYPKTDEIEFYPNIESIKSKEEIKKLLRLWSKGGSIDPEKNKMHKRFDISEGELGFINESITSKEIQEAFGAPHYYIELRETKDMQGNEFVYELESGDILKIVYFSEGYILRAWVEDEDGNEVKLLVDRDVESFL